MIDQKLWPCYLRKERGKDKQKRDSVPKREGKRMVPWGAEHSWLWFQPCNCWARTQKRHIKWTFLLCSINKCFSCLFSLYACILEILIFLWRELYFSFASYLFLLMFWFCLLSTVIMFIAMGSHSYTHLIWLQALSSCKTSHHGLLLYSFSLSFHWFRFAFALTPLLALALSTSSISYFHIYSK